MRHLVIELHDPTGYTLWMATLSAYYAQVGQSRFCPVAPVRGAVTTQKGNATAAWVDMMMDLTKRPSVNLDLLTGASDNTDPPLDVPDRMLVSRHPLKAGTAVFNKPIPGAINMGYHDGHAALFKFQDWTTLLWYKGYAPTANRPW
ncbi:MAG TPA: hypothetical protein VNZ25_03025 [Candidatus Angelobacter sp.]|jgi:prepilin-type processing-associated H-X9-DG protein|nr:hypothetical protein [Candidatus Angelobacter sp.]